MDIVSLLAVLDGMEERTVSPVLATIVRTTGHSYRKKDAAMLILPGGTKAGSISPGCLEDDLQARADIVASSGMPELVAYNMKPHEDAIWGEAIGCGGEITVLLEAVQGELLLLLQAASQLLQNGEPARLCRQWQGPFMGYTLSRGLIRGTGFKAARTDQAFLDSVWMPKPRLILFGAGHDAEAIAALAENAGFHVITTDWRDGRLISGHSMIGSPAEIQDSLNMGRGDYLIVCSHHQLKDRAMLEQALPLGLSYIGILGSRARIAMLLDGLIVTSNLHAPVGLPIGADGPLQIAISIAAELIAVHSRSVHAAVEREDMYENRLHLFGGGLEQEDGRAEAVAGAGSGHHGWRPGLA
ncbi:XdhC family protein [Paenibacillus sp. OV219]|uniref:XdhC family protein n=1 Tax=Paenibacillus sp. OV219 TaxID=1884377 RepID=UPI0008BBDDD4|nr:XdhC family protein [Paenibacillus sp. OV219]SEM86497.1 xanthine dehydrogenase accessory factor [Paenibacillus sp. OV219]